MLTSGKTSLFQQNGGSVHNTTLAVIRPREIAVSLQKSDKQSQEKCYLNGNKKDASSQY